MVDSAGATVAFANSPRTQRSFRYAKVAGDRVVDARVEEARQRRLDSAEVVRRDRQVKLI